MENRQQLIEEVVQNLRTISNKQVEIFDRLRQVEERVEGLMERVRKVEERTHTLGKAVEGKFVRS